MRSHKRILPLLLLSLPPLLLCALLVFRYLPKDTPQENAGHFALLIERVDGAIVPQLRVGDRLLDRQSRHVLGDIEALDEAPCTEEVFSEARGALVLQSVPGYRSLRLTIAALERDGAVFTPDGDAVRLGQIYYFRTHGFSGEGRVVALL